MARNEHFQADGTDKVGAQKNPGSKALFVAKIRFAKDDEAVERSMGVGMILTRRGFAGWSGLAHG